MPKEIPQVAIITRTKDRPLLLDRALRSVSAQTLRDFVLVIINDGGDPKPVDELVKKYESDFEANQVKVIHNHESNGMEAASNKAIKSVDSVYMAIHDDDDSWAPECLEQAVRRLEETGAMGVVVTTDMIVEELEDNSVKLVSKSRWHPELHDISLYKMCLDNFATPITFIYRREVYKTIGYYDESLPTGADWHFGLRFLLKYDIDYLETKDALAFYHHRPANKGNHANSVYGSQHERNLNMIRNRLLRDDIAEGKLGIGYIVNSLNFNHQVNEESIDRVRIEVQEARNQSLAQGEDILKETHHLERVMVERTSIGIKLRHGMSFIKHLPDKLLGKS